MFKTRTVSLAVALLWPAMAAAQPTVDGAVDALYGSAAATDPSGDGNGSAVMDLTALHLWHDSTDLYITLSVTADITASASNWGKYIIYIDTTNDSSGATSDAWTRNVAALDPHKPEYSINTWVDQAPYGANRVELWQWSGSWTKSSTGVTAAALASGIQGSVIELRVPLAQLGSPQQIWIEAFSTGNGSTDNAQDTVNSPADDWNATDWSTQSQLKVSTNYSLASVTPDGGPPADSTVPDSAPPAPDAGPGLDSCCGFDQTIPTPDQTVPTPDQTTPSPDQTTPSPDMQQTDGPPASDLAPGDDVFNDDAHPTIDSFVDSGPTKPKQDEGCACAVGAVDPAAGLPWLALLGLLALLRRRRS